MIAYQAPDDTYPIELENIAAEQWLRLAKAEEATIRNLARPFFRRGYYPEELTVVRQPFQHPDGQGNPTRNHLYLRVEIQRTRRPARLWIRRQLRNIRRLLLWRA